MRKPAQTDQTGRFPRVLVVFTGRKAQNQMISQPVSHMSRFSMSCIARKPVFEVSIQKIHKPGCTATEDG